MATIKPIEGRSVHQIQSGQVIVDLCSVVKELVENSLDARATSIDVRFKNYGLDSIEVQDNGAGIASEDFETIALKHYTSKLSNYADLSTLQTFGFRGEALSSLCALSKFHIITARASDGPKGTRLEFEPSGKLKETSVVASQKGTIVAVENLFYNLPVRRRELEKNIKREYGKVLNLLHAYACISTGVRVAVSQQISKGKKVVVFSTKANTTTKENISQVYGAKTVLALVPLDLKLEMNPLGGAASSSVKANIPDDTSREVHISGHISRPVVGEGRSTPDRQMFFVNSRPCALPQVTKAFNEVYKSYNVTQSAFIFANLVMDTNAYDVNVSPDKRTILLHDQSMLLEKLKECLVDLFENHDQSVPQSQFAPRKLPGYKPLSTSRETSKGDEENATRETIPTSTEDGGQEGNETQTSTVDSTGDATTQEDGAPISFIKTFVERNADSRREKPQMPTRPATNVNCVSKSKQNLIRSLERAQREPSAESDQQEDNEKASEDKDEMIIDDEMIPTQEVHVPRIVEDFNARIASPKTIANPQKDTSPHPPLFTHTSETPIPVISTPQKMPSSQNTIQNAFDRMRMKRTPQQTATITVGDRTSIVTIGSSTNKRRRIHEPQFFTGDEGPSSSLFSRKKKSFAAPGTEIEVSDVEEEINDVLEEDGDSGEEVKGSVADVTTLDHAASPRSDNDAKLYAERSEEESEKEDEQSSSDKRPVDADVGDTDDEYIDEEEKKAREDARVTDMIAKAEEAAARPSSDNLKRATNVFKSGNTRKHSTLKLVQQLDTTVTKIEAGLISLNQAIHDCMRSSNNDKKATEVSTADTSPEERLSLTVSKSDFGRMSIIGQFNLGFILTVRPASTSSPPANDSLGKRTLLRTPTVRSVDDELFIIDQHASDEKYNFERLRRETILQPQRLVRPLQLELTAVEEEVIINNPAAIAANGFQVEIDESGERPVGRCCRLLGLPMSREVTFTTEDLEELIALLSESGTSSSSALLSPGIVSASTLLSLNHLNQHIPRPSKVRRLLAMRACRGSIMIGKTLTEKQMRTVVRNLGDLEKPWNCPHGRPTMRHLTALGTWEGWGEGDGLVGMERDGGKVNWREYVEGR
ncbi:DNA mismatch repair protein MutL [Patellaria atrata CBS 101060]|uniref:DNA mismatch repair protein PMS1 n=1 Tax=Patellaria atrata CBS 101060 TaxID=1346257 RepID=A0A9P4S8G2_9PEZI|nr:DNA mismatch repair protein MutL [Patellaria atrata CBS 101060]